ncbi:MAG: hypothetical protein AAF351_00615 [Pseudomonadota bacterium]
MKQLHMSEQYGGADFDDVHDHGPTTAAEALSRFDAKVWTVEVQAAEANEGCSPTLSLTRADEGRVFWVSPFLDGAKLRFVNDYVRPLENPGLFSRLIRRTHTSTTSRDLSPTEARHALELFAQRKYSDLVALISEKD